MGTYYQYLQTPHSSNERGLIPNKSANESYVQFANGLYVQFANGPLLEYNKQAIQKQFSKKPTTIHNVNYQSK